MNNKMIYKILRLTRSFHPEKQIQELVLFE